MKGIYNKLRYRWDAAPLWIKIADTTCWVTLILFLVIIL
jgi:hypothetical protein